LRQHRTSSRLEKYGITTEMYQQARAEGKKWCFWHKQFEHEEKFRPGRRLCKRADAEQTKNQYDKLGNTRSHHAPKGFYKDTLALQNNGCALCGQPEEGRRLSIDHDHSCCDSTFSCGKCLRGLLCPGCNIRIGHVESLLKQGTVTPFSGTWLGKALAYLRKWQKSHSKAQEIQDGGN
jgi:hypothetical protein